MLPKVNVVVAIMSARGVSEPERTKLLEQWERVSFRIFSLCGKDARTKVGDYLRLAKKIVADEIDARTYNQIMAALKQLGAEYPIDMAISEGLVKKDCYGRSPEMCRYILWQYEEYLARSHGAGGMVDAIERTKIWKLRASDSVEHICPQSYLDVPEWKNKLGPNTAGNAVLHVGRIGNLILLPIRLNQEAKVQAFKLKRSVYERHNLRMIRLVCSEADWTLAQIEAREDKIVAWAKSQWNDV